MITVTSKDEQSVIFLSTGMEKELDKLLKDLQVPLIPSNL